jgi:hypothetical protein
MQLIEFARRLDAKTAAERLNLQNSLLISLLAGNLTVETGSTATASATTHSRATRDFLKLREWPRFGGISSGVRSLQKGRQIWSPVLRFCLWPRNPVARQRRPAQAETGST